MIWGSQYLQVTLEVRLDILSMCGGGGDRTSIWPHKASLLCYPLQLLGHLGEANEVCPLSSSLWLQMRRKNTEHGVCGHEQDINVSRVLCFLFPSARISHQVLSFLYRVHQ